MNRRWTLPTVLFAATLLAGCESVSAKDTTPEQTPVTTLSAAPAAAPAPAAPPAGRVIVIDPGHNGAGADHPDEINRQVSDGRGGTKACNTTGTAADDGYTEHEFNWEVGELVRDDLTAEGFRVIMSRSDDNGVGPCVDERGLLGNRNGAAAVVSIHADGAPASAHGFHMNYASPALNDAQRDDSVRLATTLRDTFVAAGFTPATYIGSDGLYGRGDLAGLNISDRPTALVECGNMRNPDDIATMESADGRARIATAIADAVDAYLS